jgi:hypothetical protein
MTRSAILRHAPLAILGAACSTPLPIEPASENPTFTGGQIVHTMVVDTIIALDAGAYEGAAVDINVSGMMVGWRRTSSGGPTRATRWNGASPGGFTDIGTLGGAASEAAAVNDLGAVVGKAAAAPGSTLMNRAFLWRPNVGIQEISPAGLGFPIGGAVTGLIAHDINNWGVIAGSASGVNGSIRKAFTLDGGTFTAWESCTGTKGMGIALAINELNTVAGQVSNYLEAGIGFIKGAGLCFQGFVTTWGEMNDVNESNVAVGYDRPGGGAKRAVRWTPANGLQSIHPANDAEASVAHGNNDYTMVVGEKIGSYQRAFVWHPLTGMVTLPDLRHVRCGLGANPGAVAYAVNDAGWIAGMSRDCSGRFKPTLWRVHVQSTDLGAVQP